MELTLSITNYNRTDLLYNSFLNVLQDLRIREIVIVDDHSDHEIYEKVKKFCDSMPKVRLIRNPVNLGMSLNKRKAIREAETDTVIILDSDNEIDSSYIDAIEREWPLDPETIYAPCFAKPQFDYRQFAGQTFDKKNISKLISDPMGNCAANTCNYVVNKTSYIPVYEFNDTIKETDTLWMLMLWIKAGYKFKIVHGMEYMHLVHPGSGWLKNANYNLKKAEEINAIIKSL